MGKWETSFLTPGSTNIWQRKNMAQSPPLPPSRPPTHRLNFWRSPGHWLYAFWKFSRPHTIIGTSLSVLGLFSLVGAIAQASGNSEVSWGGASFVLLTAWLACLAGNVYIVGLNQLEDVDIDRINKPHLPLASGEFSQGDGRWIVGGMAGVALALAAAGGPWLGFTLMASLIIGTLYSLPPVRLKRFPLWASFCILAVRGGVVNLGLFLHFSDRLGQPLAIPLHIWALTGFVVIFSVAIALFKDIPDLEGDRHYNIRTFTVTLGQTAVFNVARGVLTLCYGGMVLVSPWLVGVHRPFVAITHLFALGIFWMLSFRVAGFERWGKGAPPLSYPDFYQFIWKLFFLEYVMFPIAAWLAV